MGEGGWKIPDIVEGVKSDIEMIEMGVRMRLSFLIASVKTWKSSAVLKYPGYESVYEKRYLPRLAST